MHYFSKARIIKSTMKELQLKLSWMEFGFISVGEQALNLVFCEIAGLDMAAPIKL